VEDSHLRLTGAEEEEEEEEDEEEGHGDGEEDDIAINTTVYDN